MDDLIGMDLGRYRILEQLGAGGMATVYKAYDARLERYVAVKIIRRGAFGEEVLESVLKRFHREAKALAGLAHPNIVPVIDYGEHEGAPYLVMPFIPGGTLKQRLGSPMPWQEAFRLLLPVAQALEYAHEHSLIHRDIKPSNILITEKGQPMLSDFGIAKILESEEATALTGTGVGVGTPDYMAPEQWSGQAGRGSDIYSLGVVLYELLTGRKPYLADTPAAILLKQATEPLPPPAQFVPGLPQEVEQVLLKSLEKKPEDRYSTMTGLVSAMERVLSGATLVAARPEEAMRDESGTLIQGGGNATLVQPPAAGYGSPPPTVITARPPQVAAGGKRRGWTPWIFAALAAGFVVLALAAILVYYLLLNGNFFPPLQPGFTEPPVETIEYRATDPLVIQTETAESTITQLPTLTPLPSPTSVPTSTSVPTPYFPVLYADQNYMCLEGPSSSYPHAVDVYQGSTHEIIGRSATNPGWIMLAINQSNTHHTCCWIGGGIVQGDITLAPYTENLCP